MLRYGTKYKEVLFGTLFGIGASLINAEMHASMANSNFLSELIQPTPVMAAYRFLFLAFGIALGFLLWLRNQRERAFRHLSSSFGALRRDLTAPPMLLHTNLQVRLMQCGVGLSKDALTAVRSAYESSADIQRVLIAHKIAR
jgi:hypothetical protein